MADRLKNELLTYLKSLDLRNANPDQREDVLGSISLLEEPERTIFEENKPFNLQELKAAEDKVCLLLVKMKEDMEQVYADNESKLSIFHFTPELEEEKFETTLNQASPRSKPSFKK